MTIATSIEATNSEQANASRRLLPHIEGHGDAHSTDAAQFVSVAAVLGRWFSIDDVAEVLGEPLGRLLPWLRELVDAGVVEENGASFAFCDADTHESIYLAIAQPLRLALHREIGCVLARRGGCMVDAAAQFERGAKRGDHLALEALDRATNELLATDPQRAAAYALGALDLTVEGDSDRVGRATTAVEALYSAGRLADAAQLARSLLAEQALPGAAEAELHLTLSWILSMNGQPGAALEHADRVIDQPHSSNECCARAEFARLVALLASDDAELAREPAEAILAGGDRPGTDDALAGALTALSSIAWHEGRVPDALGLMRAAIRRADREPVVGRQSYPRLCLAAMLTTIGEVDDAAQSVRAGQREINHAGDTPWATLPSILDARLLLADGRLDDAGAQITQALHAPAELGETFFSSLALATLAEIALLRGDIATARDCVTRCLALPLVPRMYASADVLLWVRGRLAFAQGGPRAALEALASVYDDLHAHKSLLVNHPGIAGWLVRTAIRAGDRARAEVVVLTADQLASDNRSLTCASASAVHARGVLDGDADALNWAADNSWNSWARASAREDAARAKAWTGEHDAARALLERALGDYERAGAAIDADRVRARLTSPNAHQTRTRRDPRPVEGWESLTESERRVADLVAKGLTNRQVAERAFLSRHTVDFHLRQVFRKLNISSRVELTRIALEQERAANALVSPC